MTGYVVASSAAAAGPAQAAAREVMAPQGWWEYALVAAAAAVVAVALAWLVLGFLRSGEDDPRHIKYSILAETGDSLEDGGCHDEA